MSILITGGTGFLGSYLTRKLIQEGEKDIVLMDAFPNPANLGDLAEIVGRTGRIGCSHAGPNHEPHRGEQCY